MADTLGYLCAGSQLVCDQELTGLYSIALVPLVPDPNTIPEVSFNSEVKLSITGMAQAGNCSLSSVDNKFEVLKCRDRSVSLHINSPVFSWLQTMTRLKC